MLSSRLCPGTALFAAMIVALGVGACGGSGGDSSGGGSGSGAAKGGDDLPTEAVLADGDTIKMKRLKFWPAKATVRVGQKVTWVGESVPHDVVAQSGADFKSEVYTAPDKFSFTPKKAGTIEYLCTLHPGMEGTLTVKDR